MHATADTPTPPGTAGANHCPGPCSARWRAAEKHRLTAGTAHDLTPRPGAPVWCGPCTRHLRTALADLPELAARLLLEIEHGTPGGTEHVSGSREAPIHQHQAAAFCIDDIAAVLSYWAEAVRELRNLATPAAGRRRGTAITDDTRLLHAHFDWLIAEHPEPAMSAEFGGDVNRVHRHAVKLTKTGDVRPERLDGVPCPRCDLKALEREVDSEGRASGYVACRSCGTLLTGAEYERWTRLAAAPLKKLAAL